MLIDRIRRGMIAAAFLTFGSACVGSVAMAADVGDLKPKSGEVRMGMNPWIGYGPWIVAEENGVFEKNGLDQVELVNFAEDKDRMAAFASGQIDFMNIPAHTALQMSEAGIPLKIVLLLDFSLDADAIVADGIDSIADIKGKEVAYEESSTSDILLNYALAENGLTINDITRVPMPAAQAGAALVAGRVPVSVTYEPYLSAAMAQNGGAKLIYTAGEAPGLISDVLIVSDKALEEKPGQIMALVQSWQDAMKIYNQNVDAGRAVIAEGVGSPVEELETAFNGVKFYDAKDNISALNGSFSAEVLPAISKAAVQSKILQSEVKTDGLIDDRFVKAAK